MMADRAQYDGFCTRCAKRLMRDFPDAALALFLSGQTWFTHVWGFKQQMMADRAQYDGFCTRCAKRLMRDFPDAALALQQVPALAPYFDVPLL